MYDKYLPIGTVVLLKDATKKIMITGFCAYEDENKEIIYDYQGCLYPEGVINQEETLLFNHKQISKVFYLGYLDDEAKEFKEKIKELMSENQ